MSRSKNQSDKQKYESFGDHYHWAKEAPRWWSVMTKHKPQRQEERKLLQLALLDYEEELIWPLSNKPIEFFH